MDIRPGVTPLNRRSFLKLSALLATAAAALRVVPTVTPSLRGSASRQSRLPKATVLPVVPTRGASRGTPPPAYLCPGYLGARIYGSGWSG